MENFRFRLSRFCAITLTGMTLGSSVWAADLMQVYQLAQQNDPLYAEARSRYEGGVEKLAQGRAALLPALSLSGAANTVERRYTDPAQSPWTRFQNYQYAVTLVQPLFRWQNWLQYEQGGLQVAQAEAEFAQARQDLLLRVAQGYFDVLVAEANLRLLDKQLEAIDQQLEQAKAYFEVGSATITDTHEAQARRDLAESQRIAAQNDLDIRQAALQVLTGQNVGDLARLRAKIEFALPQPASQAHWLEAAAEQSPTVQARAASVEVARLEAGKQQAGHLPTLDLVGTLGRAHDYTFIPGQEGKIGMGLASTEQNVVGIQLNIPLYQGGGVSARAREAAANYLAAKSGLEYARRQAVLGARQAYLGVVNGIAQVKALGAAEESSRLALESNKLGYEVGVRINIDVLNAEQQVQATRRDLVRARFETLLAQLKLKAAIGALSEADLMAVNQSLE